MPRPISKLAAIRRVAGFYSAVDTLELQTVKLIPHGAQPAQPPLTAMIDPKHPKLSIVRQRELIGLGRSSWYYEPVGESADATGADQSLSG